MQIHHYEWKWDADLPDLQDQQDQANRDNLRPIKEEYLK
jgi:hypothetical protein